MHPAPSSSNPLDSGPQNVLGKRPPLVDPFVLDLVGRMERYIGQPDMEFEARLGVLALPSMSTSQGAKGTRLPLPILTEAVLEPSGSCMASNGKPFKYEFQAGLLSKEDFDRVHARLELFQTQKFEQVPPQQVFKVVSSSKSRTVDEVYKKPQQCRVRYDWAQYPPTAETEPLEFIVKENLEKIDVWMGHYLEVDDEGSAEEEGQQRHPLDYRVAVNRERKLDRDLLSQLNRADCVMRRERVRTSFEMKAWVVDLTVVTELGSPDKYEVEAELKADLLLEQLARRAAGKSHGAYQILTDFLFFMRDFACIFGPGAGTQTRSNGPGRYPDMSPCDPPEELKRKFQKITNSNVLPIIGDYLFQITHEIKPAGQ